MPKITKTAIDNLAPDLLGDHWLWDSELPGFGVRVQPSGRKTYVVRYRNHDGVQRKQNVCRCVDAPPDRARDMARKIFAQVAEGKDPREERQTARSMQATVEDLKVRYMAEHAVPPNKKPSSIASDEKNWRVHVLPALGKKKVTEVTDSDISKLVTKLANSPATGNQVIALLSKAFGLAEKWKMRPKGSNPARGLKKYKIKERELILTPEQIGKLHQTLDAMVDDGRIKPSFAAFIRLLLVTGCRKCEIMHARRSWIDRERGLLLLPDSKTGQKKVALSPLALEILSKLGEGGEWLIPGRNNGQPLKTPYKVWTAVKKEAGLPEELRLHDLRHTAGSLAHMNGATQLEVAKLLGHKQLSTTERYLHGFSTSAARTADNYSNVISLAIKRPPEEAAAA